MRRRDIPWQQFVEERKWRAQSAVPIITVETKLSANVVAKDIVLLEKPESDHPRSMFFVLAIAVGLGMYLLNLTVTSMRIVKLASLMDFVNFLIMLLMIMVAYKTVHNQKVIW